MKKLLLFIALSGGMGTAYAQKSDLQKTIAYYNRSKATNDLAKMSLFFAQMPKGGDLHHHYSGAVYAETYLDWMEDKDLYINFYTFKPQQPKQRVSADSFISVYDLRMNSALYRNLLTLWSTMDFSNYFHDQSAPDLQFFNTFGYFGSVSGNYKAGLDELKTRAVQENVQYIETMLSSVYVPITSTTYNDALYNHLEKRDEYGLNKVFDSLRLSLDENVVRKAVDGYNSKLNDVRRGIDDYRFTMRFQTYTTRNTDPSTIFIALYGAFRACAANSYIVGVNFVGPENGVVAMKDYWLHMRIFRYFKSLPEFKNIHIALHAGELALGMVKPEDMGYHIHDALTIAGAERIGHGVDLPYENEAPEIMRHMAQKGKAVEINLVSNEFILGIKNERHPVRMYYDAKVPMVISTDDAGVSRSTLGEQYVLLASRYTFSYTQLKELVYNSITYSFLPQELKEQNKVLLKTKFAEFEKKIASLE